MDRDDIRLEFNRREFTHLVGQSGFNAMFAATEHMKGKLYETLSGNRSGRTYRVPGTRKTYTASAPGEAPASRLGDLRRSIDTRIEQGETRIEGFVGTDLEYGLFLERGTLHIKPRPWLGPTFQKEAEAVKRILSEPW
jgi:hypothetical protein